MSRLRTRTGRGEPLLRWRLAQEEPGHPVGLDFCAASLKTASTGICTGDPAILQRLARLASDLDGHMRKTLAHVPVKERRPEADHSANARDTE